jgi:hypothetical protein
VHVRYGSLTLIAILGAAFWSAVACAQSAPSPAEGPAAIALLDQQRAANGIPPVTDNQQFAAAWCPDEDNGPSGGELGRDLAFTTVWSSSTSPWDDAPLHQQDLYNPLFTQAGDVNVGHEACFGPGVPEPEPSAPTFYMFISEVGNVAVPNSETVYGEGPIAPQQAVGLPLGVPTGPDILLYGLGFPQETIYAGNGLHAIGWTLSAVDGATVPKVKLVDSNAVAAFGYPGYLDGDVGVMIPPVLQPGTAYVGSVVWQGPTGATATQTFSFNTALSPNSVTINPGYKRNRAGRWTGNELFGVDSQAPSPIFTLTNRHGRVTTLALHLTSMEQGTGYYLGTIRLTPGPWLLCVRSGGPPTGFLAARHCQRFRVARHVASIP